MESDLIKKIKLVDSGSGIYNTLSYLSQLLEVNNKDISVLNDFEPVFTYKHLGDLKPDKLFNLFVKLRDYNNLSFKDTYIVCNTLNSVINGYNGAYNQLVGYLISNRDKNNLVLCTNNTKNFLKKLRTNYNLDFSLKSYNCNLVRKIDNNEVISKKINGNYDNLILGCTHYDLINWDTNIKNIISTSKLSANKIYKDLEFKGVI